MSRKPRFRIGDFVRVMQVPEMERKGYANLCGAIYEMHPESTNIEEWAKVMVAGDKPRYIQVPTDSLMRISVPFPS